MDAPPLKDIVAQMGTALGENSGLGGTIKFDFGDVGSVFLDGKSTPNSACDGAGKNADCTIKVSIENFAKMANGELDGTSAYMQGKLSVMGDMTLAMKVGPLLQRARS
jgi:putative sterol carrier protein